MGRTALTSHTDSKIGIAKRRQPERELLIWPFTSKHLNHPIPMLHSKVEFVIFLQNELVATILSDEMVITDTNWSKMINQLVKSLNQFDWLEILIESFDKCFGSFVSYEPNGRKRLNFGIFSRQLMSARSRSIRREEVLQSEEENSAIG